MHIITLSEKKVMDLKESRVEYMGKFEGSTGKGYIF